MHEERERREETSMCGYVGETDPSVNAEKDYPLSKRFHRNNDGEEWKQVAINKFTVSILHKE